MYVEGVYRDKLHALNYISMIIVSVHNVQHLQHSTSLGPAGAEDALGSASTSTVVVVSGGRRTLSSRVGSGGGQHTAVRWWWVKSATGSRIGQHKRLLLRAGSLLGGVLQDRASY